jgi:TcpE family
VDLPTYTNIWRIEKRLYKIYDLRLPMPLPISQIAVFAGVTVPYIVLLKVVGVPFNHSLFALYVLPPLVATWLVTRPVLENKRLTELLASQLRYLAEPREWCRMMPLAEPDEIVLIGRVWRRSAAASRSAQQSVAAPAQRSAAPSPQPPAGTSARPSRPSAAVPPRSRPAARPDGPRPVRTAPPDLWRPPQPHSGVRPARPRGAQPGRNRPVRNRVPAAGPPGRAEVTGPPASEVAHSDQRQPATGGQPQPATADQRQPVTGGQPQPVTAGQATVGAASRELAGRARRPAAPSAEPAPQSAEPAPQSAEPAPQSAESAARSVERVVHTGHEGPGDRGPAWRGRAKVVAGGLGPGRPDPGARDASRARMPLAGPRRIVFLGCTGGAGQTTVAALTARTLAALRAEPVAVLDLNPGHGSMSEQLREAPAVKEHPPSGTDRPGGVDVITSGTDRGSAQAAGRENGELSTDRLNALIGDRHQLTVLDPAAPEVARVLPLAGQLVLVAPASSDAPQAIAMTHEWLEGHGYGGLSARAITVINGVSRRSLALTEQAEAVARGRCHAIVRVPWDARLAGGRAAGTDPDTLQPQTRHAYAALAGVIVSALAVTRDLTEREEGRALR